MTTIADYKGPPAQRLGALKRIAWESPSSLTLWIGAGFGKLFAGLPLWSELLTQLAAEVDNGPERELVSGLIAHGRLQVAAELLTELKGPRLSDKICALFASEKADLSLNPLCKLHPGTVITTNYDTLLDRIFPEYRVIHPRDPIESIFNFRPKLVKLHGSVSNPASIVLNVTSYAKAYDKELEWFLAHVFQNTTVLFVGSGLADVEPYMRFIRLLNASKLLRGHHYAIMPFHKAESDEATEKLIRDRSNVWETVGIRTLPYVVANPSDHRFVIDLLQELQPNSTDALSKIILSMETALDLYGPENIGPALFRLFATLDRRQLDQKPFLALVIKFLRELRQQNRKDLGRLWRDHLRRLISYHEDQTKVNFSRELEGGVERSSKAREIEKNKTFIYDSTT